MRVAEGLKELGIQPGDVITFAGKNGIDIFAAAAGVLYQRGVPSPIDPSMKSCKLGCCYSSSNRPLAEPGPATLSSSFLFDFSDGNCLASYELSGRSALRVIPRNVTQA